MRKIVFSVFHDIQTKMPALLFIALFCASAFAQELPKIAVYVTGAYTEDGKTALGTRILGKLVNSGRYRVIERSNLFLAEIEKEHVKQRSGAVDDSQISELGKQFGAKFICIAHIAQAFGSFQVSARILNVETAEVEYSADDFSQLQSPEELEQVSSSVIEKMFREKGAQTPKPIVTYTPPGPAPRKPDPTREHKPIVTYTPPGPARQTDSWGDAPDNQAPTQESAAVKQEAKPTSPEKLSKKNTARIYIATEPPDAAIYIDGKLIGRSYRGKIRVNFFTYIFETEPGLFERTGNPYFGTQFQIPVGTHEVRFVKDNMEKTETLAFSQGYNPSLIVTLDGSVPSIMVPLSPMVSSSWSDFALNNPTLLVSIGRFKQSVVPQDRVISKKDLAPFGIVGLGKRTGAMFMNIVVPGTGSLMMGDYTGALVIAGFVATGIGITALGISVEENSNGPGLIAGTGISLIAVGWFGGAYRPFYYNKGIDLRKLPSVAVLPDKDGNLKGYLAYSFEF